MSNGIVFALANLNSLVPIVRKQGVIFTKTYKEDDCFTDQLLESNMYITQSNFIILLPLKKQSNGHCSSIYVRYLFSLEYYNNEILYFKKAVLMIYLVLLLLKTEP